MRPQKYREQSDGFVASDLRSSFQNEPYIELINGFTTQLDYAVANTSARDVLAETLIRQVASSATPNAMTTKTAPR